MMQRNIRLVWIAVALIVPLLVEGSYLALESKLPEPARRFAWLVAYSSGMAVGAVIVTHVVKTSRVLKAGLVIAYLGLEHLVSFFFILCFHGIVFGDWL